MSPNAKARVGRGLKIKFESKASRGKLSWVETTSRKKLRLELVQRYEVEV